MTKGFRTLIRTLLVILITLLPATALVQEQTPEPAAPARPDEGAAPAKPGELNVPAREGTEPAPVQAQQSPAKEATGKYIIKQGDTLWDISNAFLKDPFLWPLLWKANPYINNPDLIYPGNKLVIPSLAPIERAMEAPAPKTPEEAAAEEKAAGAAAIPPAKPSPAAPAQPAPEEEAAAKPRIILPEEAPVPIIDKYSMLNAGFINMEDTDDMIIGSWEPKTVFAYDDIVYIHIASSQNTNVGDKFIIYDPLQKVRHPVTGEVYGRLIRVLGVLQVTAKDSPDVLTARITLSFNACEKGSRLTPYQEPTLLYESGEKKTKNIAGYILEVVDGRTINAQGDIVYLDKGSADGVEPGDRFTVYIDPQGSNPYGMQYKERYQLPRRAIGEVQVFIVKERTSTAVVRKSVDTMAIGDMVESKK